jgi:hypothetical protein
MVPSFASDVAQVSVLLQFALLAMHLPAQASFV